MPKKFLRRDISRFSKLGKKRKKLQIWRKPKGRDNKMRLKRKSYPSLVSIGYKTPKKDSGKVNGLLPVLIHNLKELEALGKDSAAVIAKIGAKKKLELIKKADELKIKILNVKQGAKKWNWIKSSSSQ